MVVVVMSVLSKLALRTVLTLAAVLPAAGCCHYAPCNPRCCGAFSAPVFKTDPAPPVLTYEQPYLMYLQGRSHGLLGYPRLRCGQPRLAVVTRPVSLVR